MAGKIPGALGGKLNLPQIQGRDQVSQLKVNQIKKCVEILKEPCECRMYKIIFYIEIFHKQQENNISATTIC